jgi:hypothetical protein
MDSVDGGSDSVGGQVADGGTEILSSGGDEQNGGAPSVAGGTSGAGGGTEAVGGAPSIAGGADSGIGGLTETEAAGASGTAGTSYALTPEARCPPEALETHPMIVDWEYVTSDQFSTTASMCQGEVFHKELSFEFTSSVRIINRVWNAKWGNLEPGTCMRIYMVSADMSQTLCYERNYNRDKDSSWYYPSDVAATFWSIEERAPEGFCQYCP